MRRALAVAAAVLALALAAATSPVHGAAFDRERLARAIGTIEKDARPAALGVGVMDLVGGETWFLSADRSFPMQSVFKAPLGAMVLDRADHGRLDLDSTLVLTAADLSAPYSPVADSFPSRSRYTVEELLVRAAGGSDNTAADVLLGLVGGPDGLTRWLRAHGIEGMRVDRTERSLQTQIVGLGRFRRQWVGEAAFVRALHAVPPRTRRRIMRGYLNARLDCLTPRSAITFLAELEQGRLLGPASTAHLLRIMTETQTGPRRLQAGLPPGATIAHKTGSGRTDLGVNPASNDIGIVTLPGGRRIAIAVLLSGSLATEAGRDSVHSSVARAVIDALR